MVSVMHFTGQFGLKTEVQAYSQRSTPQKKLFNFGTADAQTVVSYIEDINAL